MKLWQWFKRLFKKSRKQVEIKIEQMPKAAPTIIDMNYQKIVRYTPGGNHTVLFDSRLNREIRKPGRWVDA
jgi:hypothetical protein